MHLARIPCFRAQADFKFYPKKVQDFFINFHKNHRLFLQVPAEKRARWIEIRNKLIKAIYDAGGKIMAGSDSPERLLLRTGCDWSMGFPTRCREISPRADPLTGTFRVRARLANPPADMRLGSTITGRLRRRDHGEELVPEALLHFCQERLPHFAVPRYVRFVDQLPKNHAQRIQKPVLREQGVEDAWDREDVGYVVRR